MSLQLLRKEVLKASNKEKAKLLSRFFKTGKGEYGEGDVFIGIAVPESRKIAIKYKNLPLKDVEQLLKSKIHEERLIALLLLVHNYQLAKKNKDIKSKEKIFRFYINNAQFINNWDLVDLSSHKIIGDYLIDKDKSILYRLVNSDNLWERRIAIISTFEFIRNNKFEDTLRISELLLEANHDLIHKAVGWMLREMGKRNQHLLIDFLDRHYRKMPRTMLRYSIEKLPEKRRKAYLKNKS